MTKKKKHGKKLSTRNDDNILGKSAMIETFARAAPFFNKTMLCTCNKKSQSKSSAKHCRRGFKTSTACSHGQVENGALAVTILAFSKAVW